MKKVIISVKGLMDEDDAELVTDGEYEFDGGARFSYEESDLTGMEGTTTSFSVENGIVSISRTGTVSMEMEFEEGRKHYFVYDTPFGSLSMGVDTQSIRSCLDENGGSLEVKYLLDLENSMMSRNSFEINIRRA